MMNFHKCVLHNILRICFTEIATYIERAIQGDEQSFLKIYNAYAKKAYYIALKMCNFCEADAVVSS